MNPMNENSVKIKLYDVMQQSEGWGRSKGREIFQRLIETVEANPGKMIFKISCKDVERVDISFASETVVELARRYRGTKGFCFVDLTNVDLLENWEAAAERKRQPLMVWHGDKATVIGPQPRKGSLEAFQFAIKRSSAKATDFASKIPGMSIANASTKFKQLWEQGFLMRQEALAESGGVEFIYYRIG